MSALRALLRDEAGATLFEYALILSLVAMVAIAGLTAMAGAISSALNNMAAALTRGQAGS